jgi:hypothetical protein
LIGGRVIGLACDAHYRRNVYDRSTPALGEHGSTGLAAAVPDTHKVDSHCLGEEIVGNFLGRDACFGCNASIVDNNVNATKSLGCGGEEGGNLDVVSNVARNREGAASDPGSDLFEAVTGAGGENDIGASLGEGFGKSDKAVRGAGYNSSLTV